MNPKEREQRWLAYFLGEADTEEQRRIEEELAASPLEAEEFRQFVKEIQSWASEPVSAAPLRMHDILSRAGEPDMKPEKVSSPFMKPTRWFWALAAAALILFSLSRISFSVRTEFLSFNWGQKVEGEEIRALEEGLKSLSARVEDYRLTATENQTMIQTLNLRNRLLEDNMRNAVSQIVHNQQIETRTRYNDLQQIMQLTGGGLSPSQTESEENSSKIPFEGSRWINKSNNPNPPSNSENKGIKESSPSP